MAQAHYRGNLSARVFPFLSTHFGQSVISPGLDQVNNLQSGGDSGGDDGIPQMYFCENVVPTAQGYKTVGYSTLLNEVGIDFDMVIPIRDPDMTRGLLGVTLTGLLYIYKAGDGGWTNISNTVFPWQGGNVSVAYASGYTYICFAGHGIYKASVATRTIFPVDLVGINDVQIQAITDAANYLILTDGITVYWSSTISAEDFVPSSVTGAGSLKPVDAQGKIVALVPLSNGFGIYTAVNVVIASYSQNARYPFVFRGADNSKGITSIAHVSGQADDGANYAWTSAGLQKITTTGAVTIFPQLTDFLTGKQFEYWDAANNKIITEYIARPLKVKIAFVGSRYLVISYGKSAPTHLFTHAIVYDSSLKRWGKLRVDHSSCFDLSLSTEGDVTSNGAASPKRTMGFVTSSGKVSITNFENGLTAVNAVMMLGKFSLTRSRLSTLQSITVECVRDDNNNFQLLLGTTLNGKDIINTAVPISTEIAEELRSYNCRITGVNHTLILKGAFNLNSFELIMNVNGRR